MFLKKQLKNVKILKILKILEMLLKFHYSTSLSDGYIRFYYGAIQFIHFIGIEYVVILKDNT